MTAQVPVIDDAAHPVATTDDRALCTTVACWLDACTSCLGVVGLACAAGAGVLLVVRAPGVGLAAAALLLTAAERYHALRLRFDAGLFAALARGALTPPAVDGALHALRLRRRPALPAPLHVRVDGARRLALRHAGIVTMQAGLLVAQALAVATGALP